MSVLYAVSVSLLIFAAVAALYLVLAANLERRDERMEVDEITNLRVILADAASAGARPLHAGSPHHQFYIRILNPDGSVRRETPGMSRLTPMPTLRWLQALPEGTVETEIITPSGLFYETQSARLASDGSAREGFAQVTMNRSHEERLLAVYRRRMALVIAAAVVATVIAGYLIARTALRPLRRISQAASEIQSSNLHARIPQDGLPVELWSLAGAFNTMLDRLEEAFTRISRFSDDVAHELRTPINNMRGELEVAISRARTPEQYRDALSSALEECERLGRIVSSLLFLSRADARSALQRETTNVARELAAVRDFYEAAAAEQGLALGLEVAPNLFAPLDRTLFQQAAGNLLSNAIAHTPPGGEIRMRAAPAEDGFTLEVSDTGSGVAAEHQPHVFERFYRADAARSGGLHVGLGLAVVRAIVERHGGQASLSSAAGGGTQVRLFFPAR